MKQNSLTIDSYIQLLIEFRKNLYESFPFRKDAVMDLIDALTCNSGLQSPTELCLTHPFQRGYASIHDAIQNLLPSSMSESDRRIHLQTWMDMTIQIMPEPIQKKIYIFGVDSTSFQRCYAQTLQDRAVQYAPNPSPGNKPITIGHSYSLLANLPEKTDSNPSPWILPLSWRRIPTDKKSTEVAVEQIQELLLNKYLSSQQVLSICVLDSIYSTCGFLNPLAEQPDLVNICRVRNNRKFYRKPEHDHPLGEKGHPVWYGNPFHLIDSSTWGTPDDQINTSIKLKNGRQVIVQIKGWNDLLMSGKKNLPMHNYPFKIVKIYVIDLEGQPIFKRPLWLMVIGKRRHEIDLMTIYTSYRQRFDLEHFFRFGKQKLLLTSYQTPEIRHEENWCQIVCLAYILLFLSSPLANNCPRPWERYLPQFREDLNQVIPSPSKVQRDMISVLKQIGTPSSPKKIRGNAPGRKKGTTLPKRERFPIVFKKRKKPKVKPP